jgi:hypothetical protein
MAFRLIFLTIFWVFCNSVFLWFPVNKNRPDEQAYISAKERKSLSKKRKKKD